MYGDSPIGSAGALQLVELLVERQPPLLVSLDLRYATATAPQLDLRSSLGPCLSACRDPNPSEGHIYFKLFVKASLSFRPGHKTLPAGWYRQWALGREKNNEILRLLVALSVLVHKDSPKHEPKEMNELHSNSTTF
jgi:hypothetical protein